MLLTKKLRFVIRGVGDTVGATEGTALETIGDNVGATEGTALETIGDTVGATEGTTLEEGTAVGASVGGAGRTLIMDIMPRSECSIM